MTNLANILIRLKKFSLFLFIFPSTAIIFSLIIHNYLVSFKFSPQEYYKTTSADLSVIDCNEANNFCTELKYLYKIKSSDLFDCIKNEVEIIYNYNNVDYNLNELQIISKKINFNQKKLKQLKFTKSSKVNHSCIKSSTFFPLYNNFKSIAFFVNQIKKNETFSFGTSNAVNPFFFGETSISNIVKRLPLAYFFKPLIYISSFLMLFYWYYNNLAAKNIQNRNKNFYFFYFGILSSIFLFFHVTFLGSNIENELFQKLRKLIVILFILFEIISQVLLVVNLRKNLKKFQIHISKKILTLKYYLISFMVIATIIILLILTFFNLSSRFDYFLEWNYFFILLFFYLFSFFLWKIKSNR